MKKRTPRMMPIFLLGNAPKALSKDKSVQDLQTTEILRRYGMNTELRHIVEKDKDMLRINHFGVDGFIVFPYTLQRFTPLVYLAETRKPIIIVSEEDTFQTALEAYDYLSDHENVQLAFSPEEVKARIKVIVTRKWFDKIKVCLFDAGNWELSNIVWQKNPLFSGGLNVENVNVEQLLDACRNVDKSKAEHLAKKWIEESEVLEPSLEDVTRCAQIYLAMKATIKKMKANATYVLWCGQFTKPLKAKLCFALAKLADEGQPVGCWRGGNLLPMLILDTAARKPVFTPEVLSRQGKTIILRHCFVPCTIGSCKYTLRRWRKKRGTVTGYCQMPKGKITLINCGIADKMVITKGEVIDCKDLEGDNCRMTVWVEIENEESIHRFVGREFAFVYGNYAEEARQIAESLGVRVLG